MTSKNSCSTDQHLLAGSLASCFSSRKFWWLLSDWAIRVEYAQVTSSQTWRKTTMWFERTTTSNLVLAFLLLQLSASSLSYQTFVAGSVAAVLCAALLVDYLPCTRTIQRQANSTKACLHNRSTSTWITSKSKWPTPVQCTAARHACLQNNREVTDDL